MLRLMQCSEGELRNFFMVVGPMIALSLFKHHETLNKFTNAFRVNDYEDHRVKIQYPSKKRTATQIAMTTRQHHQQLKATKFQGNRDLHTECRCQARLSTIQGNEVSRQQRSISRDPANRETPKLEPRLDGSQYPPPGTLLTEKRPRSNRA